MNFDYKEKTWKAATALFGVLTLFLIIQIGIGVKSWLYFGKDAIPQATLSFTGKGEVTAVPDTATITFSVTKSGATVAVAQEAMNKIANAAIAYLKEKGIDEKDIKTTDYSVYPKYEYTRAICSPTYCPPSNQILVGYEVSETVTVKIREVASAGEILSNLGETGVTNISGLNFTVDNEDELIRQARQKAIDDAKTKAVSLSKDLGVKLVRIIGFNEGGNYPMPIYYGKAEALGMGGDATSSVAPDIQTGENKITSNVTITYEIR